MVLAIPLVSFANMACQRSPEQSAAPAVSSTSPTASDPVDCRNVEHEVGTTEVCGQPQRIVALGPYVLEHLLALGVQPIGFSDYAAFHQGDYDDPSQQIPLLGSRITQPLANVGLAETPSLEAILKAHPDLILGTTANAAIYDALSDIAPTVLLERFDPEASLQTVAQAVDRSEQVGQVFATVEQHLTSARDQLAPVVANHPNVLLLITPQLQEIYLGSNYEACGSPIEAIGFQLVYPPNVDATTPKSWVPMSIETLPKLNEADVIILLGASFSEFDGTSSFEEHQLSGLKQAWEENAIAQSLDASKAGQVYFIPAYLCAGLPGAIGTELYLNALENQLLD
ncbi:MAG: iron-siderophore ABC transporter substrate-binding protein [Cyanobacteria bacterium P01_E01_bin.6]